MPAVSALRRIRLFLYAGRHAGGRQERRRLRGDHHEGPRPFSDERESDGIFKTPAAGAGADRDMPRQHGISRAVMMRVLWSLAFIFRNIRRSNDSSLNIYCD